ncbi:hypothetical protein Gogos_019035, partial [Gossypium gossypioides]|nr:hypothetical protein [Gossypium gossypioides]
MFFRGVFGESAAKEHLADLVWTNRSCNMVADLICKKMYTEARTWFFDMDYPSDIHDANVWREQEEGFKRTTAVAMAKKISVKKALIP